MPDTIKSPRDLDAMGQEELYALCGRIRDRIIRVCANGGGTLPQIWAWWSLRWPCIMCTIARMTKSSSM